MSRKSELAQIWAERISACQADGSNIKSWCRDNNVSASEYYYWIKKLNSNDNEIIEAEGVEWAEVSLVSQEQNMNNGNSIILNYNDFKIEIPKNIKRGDIAEVLAAIVSVC